MGSCVFQQPLSLENSYFTPYFNGKYVNIAGLDLKPIQLDYLTMKNISIYNNFVMEAQNTASCGILTAIFYKKPKYLINGESNKKSVRNKSDGKFNFLYGVCCQI